MEVGKMGVYNADHIVILCFGGKAGKQIQFSSNSRNKFIILA
jgi:hypothetical protein